MYISKLSSLILASLGVFLAVTGMVFAASLSDVTFPIAELGNCANKAECKVYCDDLSHADECAAFARAHGLGNDQSVKQAAALPDVGPGGCKSASECKTYCDDPAHADECINFAETHGLMSKKEVQRAQKAITIKGPGECRGIKECKAYCSDEAHKLECVEYGHKQGQISDESYQTVKEISTQGGPGGCKKEEECRSYCENPDHLDECLQFGEKHGFVSHDEAKTIRKAGFAGAGPGGCKGEQCRSYCEAPEHHNECIDFAVDKGFMSKEEAERARKFAGKTGPGGCKGEQCRTFCENPDHTEECLAHAEKEGFIPKAEAEKARKFLTAAKEGGPGGCKGPVECRSYCENPAHEEECFAFGKKQGLIRPEDEKQFETGRQIRKKVEQNGGPGGCKNDNECRTYCSDAAHTEECIAFATAHGGISDAEARLMLKQFTSDQFSSQMDIAPDEIRKFQKESAGRFEEFKQLEKQFRQFGGPGMGGGQEERGGFRMPLPPGGIPGQPPGSEEGEFGHPEGMMPPGFVGPGGCTNAAECIKYCSEHKEECFSHGGEGEEHEGFSPEGEGGQGSNARDFSRSRGQKEGVPFEDGGIPQLRSNIVHEFKSEDLPEGFEQRSQEEKQRFFKEQFQRFRQQGKEGKFNMPAPEFSDEHTPPGFDHSQSQWQKGYQYQDEEQEESGSFRNKGSWPDKSRMMAPPKGREGFRSPNQDNEDDGSFDHAPIMDDRSFKGQKDFRHDQRQFMPPPGMRPGQQMPPGYNPQMDQGNFENHQEQGPHDGQYQWQFNHEGSMPPPSGMQGGMMPPSGGGMMPPPGGMMEGGNMMGPPPGGNMPPPSGDSSGNMPPPSGGTSGGSQPPPPSSFGPLTRYFAALLQALFGF